MSIVASRRCAVRYSFIVHMCSECVIFLVVSRVNVCLWSLRHFLGVIRRAMRLMDFLIILSGRIR